MYDSPLCISAQTQLWLELVSLFQVAGYLLVPSNQPVGSATASPDLLFSVAKPIISLLSQTLNAHRMIITVSLIHNLLVTAVRDPVKNPIHACLDRKATETEAGLRNFERGR